MNKLNYLAEKFLTDKHEVYLQETAETEEKLIFETPLDIFKWIKKEEQYLYVKQNKEGKFEGKTHVKSKTGWTFVNGTTANRAVSIYNKVSDENKKKLDGFSLEKFLSIVWKV